MESKLRSVLRLLVKYEECVETLEENEKAHEQFLKYQRGGCQSHVEGYSFAFQGDVLPQQ